MLTDWPPFHALAKALAEGHPCLRVAGLQGAARALAVAELLQTTPRPALVLVPGIADAHRFAGALAFFGAAAAEFPEQEPRLWRGGRQREADAERALVSRRLAARGAPGVGAVAPGRGAPPRPPAPARGARGALWAVGRLRVAGGFLVYRP